MKFWERYSYKHVPGGSDSHHRAYKEENHNENKNQRRKTMEKDEVYQRQRAVIEAGLRGEELRAEVARIHRGFSSRIAYFKIMATKRRKIVRDGKPERGARKSHTAYTKSERQVYRTYRFDNSYATVYCKGRAR